MLYHLALPGDWVAARAMGEYRVSTLGATLGSAAFIHASFAHQVRAVADRFYSGVDGPLELLVVDEAKLSSPWRVDPVAGAPEGFPHVYGPIDVDAVVDAVPVRRDADGSWLGLPAGA